MEKNNEILSEERYQKTKKKIARISAVILIVGLLLGAFLITIGIIKQGKVAAEYSNESLASLQDKLDSEKEALESKETELEEKVANALNAEKQKLENKKQELISKGIKYDTFAKYDDGESYDLKIVTKALDPSFNNCAFDEYKNNSLTSDYCLIYNKKDEDSKNLNVIVGVLESNFDHCLFDEYKNNAYTAKYCSLKDEINDKSNSSSRIFNSHDSLPFYMFGAFVIIASCMISGSIYMISKRREIMAFTTQQVMPVAQEGIEKMAPSVGKAGASIFKEVAPTAKEVAKEMAPVYGEMAKEVAKGIKEGLKEDNEKNK